MEFQAKAVSPLSLRTGTLVLPIFEDGKLPSASAELDKANAGLISKLIKQGDAKGSLGSTYSLINLQGCKAERVLLLGFGKSKKSLLGDQFDKALAKAAAAVKASASKDVTLDLSEIEVDDRCEGWKSRQTAKLFANALYQFTQLKSKKAPVINLKKGIYLVAEKGQVKAVGDALNDGTAIAAVMALAKNPGNLTGNICTPPYLCLIYPLPRPRDRTRTRISASTFKKNTQTT